MAERKTRDGIKTSKVVKVATQVGASVRKGTNHKYVLEYSGLRACPVDASTNARTMVVPWLKEATSYNTNTIYSAMRNGKW
jgi:hypothetical protein